MNERLAQLLQSSENTDTSMSVPFHAQSTGPGAGEGEPERLRKRLRELASEVVVACEAARAHLARELHDGVGPELTAARFALASLAPFIAASSFGADAFAVAQRSLDAACEASRRLVAELHAPPFDGGIVGALSQWIRAFSERTGLRTSFLCAADARLAQLQPGAVLAVFRVAQEALTNVAKHAQARCADVRIETDGRHLTLVVTDDGRGMPRRRRPATRGAATTGFGLVGMRARCEAFGGALRVASRRAQTARNARSTESTQSAQSIESAHSACGLDAGTTVRARFAWLSLIDLASTAAAAAH